MCFPKAHGAGLYDIVRCAGGQTCHRAVFSVQGRQNDHGRQCGKFPEQICAHAASEDQVQNNGVEISRFRQKADRFVHIGRRKDGIFGKKIRNHFFLSCRHLLQAIISAANGIIHKESPSLAIGVLCQIMKFLARPAMRFFA